MRRPAIVRAQAPLKVTFVQQRGLLYLPVDIMVSGGILQKEADKLGLGKIEATATALSGPGPVLDAILSGAADYGTAALPSLLTLWERTRGSANEVKAVGTVSNGAMTLYTINPNVKTIADFKDTDRIAVPTVRLSFNAMMLQMAAEEAVEGSPSPRPPDRRAWPPGCGHRALGRLRQGLHHRAYRRAALHRPRPEAAGRAHHHR